MKIDEFELLIANNHETPNLDFKSSMPWGADEFLRDLISFANTDGGGRLIIGVDEDEKTGVYKRSGIDANDETTYIEDEMKDQVKKFVEPRLEFFVDKIIDVNGLHFVVITIKPFEEIPVLPIKSNKKGDVKPLRIYHRNRDRRVQSAEVSNISDLRDILNRAAVAIVNKNKSYGWEIGKKVDEFVNSELQKVEIIDIVKKIKTKGYWRVTFNPLGVDRTIESDKKKLSEIIYQKSVNYTGWDFPHTDFNNPFAPSRFDKYIQYGSDLTDRDIWKYIELWRFYENGLFFDYKGIAEDWDHFDKSSVSVGLKKDSNDELLIGSDSILYFATNVFQFLSRLSNSEFYNEGVEVTIEMNGAEDRILYADAFRSVGFSQTYKASQNIITFKRELNKNELIQNSKSLAMDVTLFFYSYFRFDVNTQYLEPKYIEMLSRSFKA